VKQFVSFFYLFHVWYSDKLLRNVQINVAIFFTLFFRLGRVEACLLRCVSRFVVCLSVIVLYHATFKFYVSLQHYSCCTGYWSSTGLLTNYVL